MKLGCGGIACRYRVCWGVFESRRLYRGFDKSVKVMENRKSMKKEKNVFEKIKKRVNYKTPFF